MPKPRILAIDDDVSFLDALELVFSRNYEMIKAFSARDGLDRIATANCDTVLLDINLPDMDGLKVLDQILSQWPCLPVIMLTGVDKTETVVEAVKKGAFDYFTKPTERDKLLTGVRNAVQKHASDLAMTNLIDDAKARNDLTGFSEAILKVKDMLLRVARSDVAVLLTGGTGTGKDRAAKLLHYGSPFSGGKFVPVNMASIPTDLMESELFGHERGAFTGAVTAKAGLFEIAAGGTIFLDEIGMASKAIQGKILRAVESKEFHRVGGTSIVTVNVRIIAATNMNLETEMEQGNFLPDLYYRLNTIRIHIPPLKERKQDIIQLFNDFMQKRSFEMGKLSRRMTDGASQVLMSYQWPGNVRELKSLVDRILVLSDSDVIDADEIVAYLEHPAEGSRPSEKAGWQTGIQQRERELIISALDANDNNISRAADALGMHRVTLHKKIKLYSIVLKTL